MTIGYGAHGYGKKGVELFDERPDHIVLMVVPSACGHAGIVDEGLRYFESVGDYKVTPDQDIYGCVVDLLRRAGRVEEAECHLSRMSLIGVHFSELVKHTYEFPHLGKVAARRILQLTPNLVGTYVMLSNIYAAESKWGVRKYEEDEETKLLFNPANLHLLHIDTLT